MGLIRDEVYAKYSTSLPRTTKPVSFYTKAPEDQDPNDTVQILDSETSPSYSTLCPLSRSLQTVPVRTDSCLHLETFDLHSCLMSETFVENCHRWTEDRVDVPVSCPVCKAEDKLHVDGLIEAFLKLNPTAQRFKITDTGGIELCNEGESDAANETINLVSPNQVDGSHHVPLRKSAGSRDRFSTGSVSAARGRGLIQPDTGRLSPVPFRHCRNFFYSPLFNQEVFSYPPTFSQSSNSDVFVREGATLRRRFSTVDLCSPTTIT